MRVLFTISAKKKINHQINPFFCINRIFGQKNTKFLRFHIQDYSLGEDIKRERY